MTLVKFLHISDTHFRKNYEGSLDQWDVTYDPPKIFEKFLANYDFKGHDFVVHTGDLVHDGGTEDYIALKALIEKYVPQELPIFYCLGNHDKKQSFHEAFDNRKNDSSLMYYATEFRGYRLVFLDTSSEEFHDGVIDEEQKNWLKDILSEDSEQGTLIFQHHPLHISWIDGLERTEVPEDYFEILQNSDTKAIFAGHLHQNRHFMYGRIPQHTANSFVFGMTREGDEIWNTNRLGYSMTTVDSNYVDVFTEIVYPEIDKLNQNIL